MLDYRSVHEFCQKFLPPFPSQKWYLFCRIQYTPEKLTALEPENHRDLNRKIIFHKNLHDFGFHLSFRGSTLPETNIAMENPPFWWYLQGKMGFSWAMLVSGRVTCSLEFCCSSIRTSLGKNDPCDFVHGFRGEILNQTKNQTQWMEIST